jgi:mannose-1-phosphate guanylyltransferase
MRASAFVLAAGFGTRLRPLTEHRPKPLVPVCGVTVLEQALGLCAQHGIDSAVVNAHHLAPAIERWCERYEGIRVRVQVEAPEILGTGGGLQLARPLLADPFAVVNGDVLCDGDLSALLEACRSPDCSAAMLLRRADDAAVHGIVAIDPAGRVVHPGTWLDVGNPSAYLDANRAVMDGTVRLPLDPWERAAHGLREVGGGLCLVGSSSGCDLAASSRLDGPCWIGEGAVIERDAWIGPHTVVGPGARVGVGARLADCVVWDGCTVPAGARLEGCVVHDGGVLRIARP